MLGKTNLTTLSEGTIVTEIEDFNWIQMQSGTYGNFVKAIYKNNYLAAVTTDGTVVHTTDGEVWQAHQLEYENCKINDIDWDGSRFLLVGSYTDQDISTDSSVGLIISTVDFSVFEQIPLITQDKEYLLIYPQNGRYILLSTAGKIVITDLSNIIESSSVPGYQAALQHILAAKNTGGFLVYTRRRNSGSSSTNYHALHKVVDGNTEEIKYYSGVDHNSNIIINVFECKDILYAMGLVTDLNYNIEKITDSNESMVMCTGQNFMFVDGTYFKECQLFINKHEMLVLKKGENFADKTLDDLIEIAPELTMNCITKAFGQLYIFGNQGVILKPSVETNNEAAIAVQTLSAKKALADAKQYTDEQYEVLLARIEALENQ